MAPNLDSFGRDRAAYQEHSRQRRIAEREARRYRAYLFSNCRLQSEDVMLAARWKRASCALVFNLASFVFVNGYRTRRRQAREQNGKRAEHKEGLSSDDEETSTDITSFNMERGLLF